MECVLLLHIIFNIDWSLEEATSKKWINVQNADPKIEFLHEYHMNTVSDVLETHGQTMSDQNQY